MSDLPEDMSADEHVAGYDPDDGEGTESSFTLASTMYDYSIEHGRRYPSYRYGSQPFPYDDLSVKNAKIFHHLFLILLDNALFVAPVKDPKSILDVRCAQGLWAENVADAFPDAEVVAMDTTPNSRSTFPNLSFLVQSFTDEWVLDVPGMKFDFIYARNLFALGDDFRYFYKQVFEHLNPGGYLEHVEVEIITRCDDGTEDTTSVIHRIANMVPQLSDASGTEYNIGVMMKDLIKETGFVEIEETRFKLPLGTWPSDPKGKQIGEWYEAYYKSGVQGWVLAPMTRRMGFTPEQVNKLCEELFEEIDSQRQHLYYTAVVVHAKKPEEGE